MFLVGSYNQVVFSLLITYVLVTVRYNLKTHFSQEELVVKNKWVLEQTCRGGPAHWSGSSMLLKRLLCNLNHFDLEWMPCAQ